MVSRNNLYHHHYPAWLLRRPGFMRLIYASHWLIHLHKWHLYPKVKQLMRTLPSGSKVVDVGFGEGQYSIGLHPHFPSLTYSLVERHQQHVEFAQAFTRNDSRKFEFYLSDAVDFKLKHPADLGLCLGVLQYCPNDDQVLVNLNKNLQSQGTLLLYVPVNGKEIIPFYQKLRKYWPDYESVQKRQRVYSEKEILDKMEGAGFKIVARTFTYGTAGILANEWMNSCLLVLVHAPVFLKMLAAIGLLASIPFMQLMMAWDYITPKQSGNCLMITAEKR